MSITKMLIYGFVLSIVILVVLLLAKQIQVVPGAANENPVKSIAINKDSYVSKWFKS
ncbi:MAG: hypothetical protein Q8778_02400 [Sweet potato little leaf phytoplasma]|nr:hypothetical protein [Sweet potato little leaf phytoplasma]